MTKYRRIAHISRVKGLNGEVVVVPSISLPFHMWEGLQLWVVPPDHKLIRETRVCSARQNANTLYLALEGVSNATTAQRLVGRSLLARIIGFECDSEPGGHSYIGLSVFDNTAGFIGTVIEERASSAQLLLVVDSPQGEVLIPAVDELIESLDDTTLHVNLPQGLLELNR